MALALQLINQIHDVKGLNLCVCVRPVLQLDFVYFRIIKKLYYNYRLEIKTILIMFGPDIIGINGRSTYTNG